MKTIVLVFTSTIACTAIVLNGDEHYYLFVSLSSKFILTCNINKIKQKMGVLHTMLPESMIQVYARRLLMPRHGSHTDLVDNYIYI